jgi:DnaK suppressor protein
MLEIGMLTEKQIELFKSSLEDRKRQIENNVRVIQENVLENEDISLLEQQTQELEEIKDALVRIEEHLYGICEMCEEEIDIERLKVKIFARYCMTCRKIIEKDYE